MGQTQRAPTNSAVPETGVPEQPSMLAALARIFRFEYLRATFPGITIPFFVFAQSVDDILHRAPVEGIVVAALMIFSCLGINAIVDREIDGQYATGKNRIAGAVAVVGQARIWAVIAAMNAIALVLTIDLCLHFQSWTPIALVLAEAVFAYGYSLPPLKFKLRGVLAHAISLSLAVCFIPFILCGYAFLGSIPAVLAAFMLGFSVLQYGYEFANQALDYLEDSKAGLRTPAVRLGVVTSLKASLVVPLVGVAILVAALLAMYVERSGQHDPARPAQHVLLAWGVSVLALAAGVYLPITRTWHMLRLSRDRSPEACVPTFPAICHYARWQASSVAGVAAAAAVFFVVTNYTWR